MQTHCLNCGRALTDERGRLESANFDSTLPHFPRTNVTWARCDFCQDAAKRPAKRARERSLVPLAGGELELIRRALRVYAHVEQDAIQRALVEAKQTRKGAAHAADVKRQCEPRILMAGYLMERLLKDPFLEKEEAPLPIIEHGVCTECQEFYVHKTNCSKRKEQECSRKTK